VVQHSGQQSKASAVQALLGSHSHYACREPGLSTSRKEGMDVQAQGAPGALDGVHRDCPGAAVPVYPWWFCPPVLAVPVCCFSFVVWGVDRRRCLAPRFYS